MYLWYITYMWFCNDTFSLNNMFSYYTYIAWLRWRHTCTIIIALRWQKSPGMLCCPMPKAEGDIIRAFLLLRDKYCGIVTMQRKQDYSMYRYMHWEVKIKPLWNAYKPLLGREECGIHWQKWSQFVRGGVPEPYWCSPSLVNGMFYGMVNLLLF